MSNLLLPRLVIDEEISEAIVQFCKQNQFQSIQLVADQNTYPVLGQAVESWLQSAGCAVDSIILAGNPLQADGNAVLQLLTNARRSSQVLIAVGSGTITDVVRFSSFILSRPFISVPTAPSVDAYTSPSSPLIVSGIKQSFPGQLPLAVFAHLPTLCAAPQAMILAGFGDMLGKLTALADWKLGSLLWDEPFDAGVAAQSRLDLQRCIDQAGAIAARQPEAIRILVESLLDSGLNMAKTGSSRPASGAEHHLAHFWEMKLLWEDRPPILHGIKVGFATLWAADAYARLRAIDRSSQRASLPDFQAQAQEIRQIYDHNPQKILAEQKRFLELTPAAWQGLKMRIFDQWPAIQAIASQVPPRSQIEQLLIPIHFPVTAGEAGLTENDINSGIAGAHYLRDRFTVFKLMYYLTRV